MSPTRPPIPAPRGQSAADDDVAGFLPGDEADEDAVEAVEVAPGEAVAAIPFTRIEFEAAEVTGEAGAGVIQDLVKRLPNQPGVYRMMNAAGDVLYVGKARSLKKRVTAYAQGRFHTSRIGRMVRETASMEFVVTRTETEALLLEILSDYQVSIPELGTVVATQIPLVFLTSNNTRELSEALKRRCLFLHLSLIHI